MRDPESGKSRAICEYCLTGHDLNPRGLRKGCTSATCPCICHEPANYKPKGHSSLWAV